MRGYAPTAVPADGRYQTGMLAMDAIGLHEALGGDGDAVIIGHDWGATATYGAAAYAPERWRRVVTMAVPPSGAVGAAFLGNLAQIKRSWYMFFFQHGLSDLVVPPLQAVTEDLDIEPEPLGEARNRNDSLFRSELLLAFDASKRTGRFNFVLDA